MRRVFLCFKIYFTLFYKIIAKKLGIDKLISYLCIEFKNKINDNKHTK